MHTERVLVMGVDSPPSYAVARALQSCGINVAGTTYATWLRSRRVECFFQSPGEDFTAENLARTCRTAGCSLVLPVSDVDLWHAVSLKDALGSLGITVLAPSRPAQLLARNKVATLQLARECGFPVPSSHVARNAAEVAAIAETADLPAIVKPAQGRSATDVILSKTRTSLAAAAKALLSRHPCIIVQEYIPGGRERSINLVVDARSHTFGSFSLRKLRYLQPSRSVAVEVIAPLAETPLAEEMARRAGWNGFVSFQTKLDERDGTNKLVEVNGRFGNNARILLSMKPELAASVLDALLGRTALRDVPAIGATGVSPIEDLLTIWLLVFQKLHASSVGYASLGNELPSFAKLLGSIARMHRQRARFDIYTRALWDDPRMGVAYALDQILPQIFPDTKCLIPWGDLET